jgi:hypothetical protein
MNKEPKPVEQQVKSFAFRLKNDFGEDISKDPSNFRARVMLKAVLPEVYVNLYAAKGLPGSWHELASFRLWGPITGDAAISTVPVEIANTFLPLLPAVKIEAKSASSR